MAFDIEKKISGQSLTLVDKKELKITGVNKIFSFDDTYVMLSTSLGDIEILGQDLKVDALDLESGYTFIIGEIFGINYINEAPKKKWRWK